MRILGLFLNNEVRTGGHRRYLELLESLAERGNEVRVLLNEDLVYEPRLFAGVRLAARYRRRGFPPASVVFAEAAKAWLKADLSGEAPDFVLIHGETHLGAAIAVKKATGAPILFGHRSNAVREALISMEENRQRPVAFLGAVLDYANYRRYEALTTRTADRIVFQSTYDRDDFVARNVGAMEKALVIGGNIGEPRFVARTEAVNHSVGIRRLLFVGTLGERKGLRYLIAAMGLLCERGYQELELDVLGPGEAHRKFQEQAKRLGVEARVRFHGRIADPFAFYAEADLMVVPSIFDSYPDTVLESFHAGIPVAGSAVGGLPEMLGRDDLLFPPRKAEAIADLIQRGIDDPAWYREIRDYCFQRRKDFRFDWPGRWETAMSEALERKDHE